MTVTRLVPAAALALVVPLLGQLAAATPARAAGVTFISFEDVSSTCYLSNHNPLRNRYAAAKFRGPAPKDGGAVLSCTDGGRTGSRFLAFNDDATMPNGGTPVGPERITLPVRQKRVTIWASQGTVNLDTATFRMVGRRGGKVIRTATATTETSDWVRLTIRSRKGFDQVKVSAPTEPDGGWRLDDLTMRN